MKIVLAGGTGFIGKALTEKFLQKNYELTILTRSAAHPKSAEKVRFVSWDTSRQGGLWEKEIDGADIVINLVGEPIAQGRWTAARKKKLRDSRIQSVQAIHRAIEKSTQRPKVLLNASAIGYYGPRGDEILDENSHAGTGFLADLCKQWEEEAMKAEALNVRTIRLRIGVVLERNGGALAKMVPPFRMGIGGPLGNGKQWMSWVHLQDLTRLILFLLEHSEAFGAFNATALNPVKMNEFAKTLGRVLHRPALFPVPGFVLKVLLGELSEMLLTGQCVLPQRAIQLGFSFQYPTLESALQAVFDADPINNKVD